MVEHLIGLPVFVEIFVAVFVEIFVAIFAETFVEIFAETFVEISALFDFASIVKDNASYYQ